MYMNPAMDARPLLAVFVVAALLGAVIGGAVFGAEEAPSRDASSGVGSTAQERSGGTFTFIPYPRFYGNVYMFGITFDNMSAPVEVRNEPIDTFTSSEQVSMAGVTWKHIPGMERFEERTGTDIGILPFQINVDEELVSGVWVRSNSTIDAPSDLDGKTIGTQWAGKPLFLLEDMYGIDVHVTGVFNSSLNRSNVSGDFAPWHRLAHEDVDAVFMYGPKRLQDNHSLQPVFLPFEELEQRFGDAAYPAFFAIKNRSGTVEKGFRMVDALQRSSRYAQIHRDMFMRIYTICNEFLVDTHRQQIQAMTPEARDALQFWLDAAYRQGVFERRVNLSDLIVREDVWVTPRD